jgi:hypothetical protein
MTRNVVPVLGVLLVVICAVGVLSDVHASAW